MRLRPVIVDRFPTPAVNSEDLSTFSSIQAYLKKSNNLTVLPRVKGYRMLHFVVDVLFVSFQSLVGDVEYCFL